MYQKPTVFFHVMKCGGTSVRAGLADGIAGCREPPRVFELDGDVAKLATAGSNDDNWRFRDALLPYVLLAMRPAVVLGHFRYRDRYAEMLDSAHFVTVLRDPVDRMVSLYRYRRYKEGVRRPVTTSFDDFIRSKPWSNEGHVFVEKFCGRDDLDPRSDEAVAAAVANLRSFTVVGFVDRLDDFSSELTRRLGATVSIPMLNRSPGPDDLDIDPGALERARTMCAPDVQLYEQVLATDIGPPAA